VDETGPGRLNIDVACGQIPVHDSQVAIPLMTMTSARVFYLNNLMDAAYDAAAIGSQSKALGHVAQWDLPDRMHAALIERAVGRRIIGMIARDATEIVDIIATGAI
jgi:hypothetical protein